MSYSMVSKYNKHNESKWDPDPSCLGSARDADVNLIIEKMFIMFIIYVKN